MIKPSTKAFGAIAIASVILTGTFVAGWLSGQSGHTLTSVDEGQDPR